MSAPPEEDEPPEPERRPLVPITAEPGTPLWYRLMRARVRRGECLHHPRDARPTDAEWIRQHGRAAGGVGRRGAKGAADA